MNNRTQDLKGSAYRDAVKYWHKHALPREFYTCDIDLALVEFHENSIPVVLDVKSAQDTNLSNTHKQLYDYFLRQEKPVFLITLESYKRIDCECCGNYEIVIDLDSDVTITEYATGQSRRMTKPEYIAWERQWRG